MRVKTTMVTVACVIGLSGLAAASDGQQAPPARATESAVPSRTVGEPSFQYRGSDGCGQVKVYAFNDDRTEVFRVEWDLWTAMGVPSREKPTWKGMKTFDLKDAQTWLKVAIDLHPSAVYRIYCTNVMLGIERRVIWRAVAGTLTIDVGENAGSESSPSFPVTATLQDGVFEAPDGRRVKTVLPIVVKTVAGRPVGG